MSANGTPCLPEARHSFFRAWGTNPWGKLLSQRRPEMKARPALGLTVPFICSAVSTALACFQRKVILLGVLPTPREPVFMVWVTHLSLVESCSAHQKGTSDKNASVRTFRSMDFGHHGNVILRDCTFVPHAYPASDLQAVKIWLFELIDTKKT